MGARRKRRRSKRSSKFARVVLALCDALRVPIGWLGADYDQFRVLMDLRLTLDGRRPASRVAMGGLAMSCAMTALMGFLGGIFLRTMEQPFWGEVLAQSVTMAFLAMILIVEFSAVFFDPSDATLVLPAPVSDRTVIVARIVHAGIYLSLLLACLVLPTLVVASSLGLRWMVLHLASSVSASALALLFVIALYITTLNRFGGERFKSAVSWAQLGVVAGIYAGMQLLPSVVREHLPADFFDRRSPWLILYPPAWFGGLVEVGLGERSGVSQGLAALACVGPILLLGLVLRLTRVGFLAALAAGGATGQRPSPKAQGAGLFKSLGVCLTAPGPERAGFHYFLTFAVRDAQFRLRVWPIMIMFVAMGIGHAARDLSLDPMWWSFALYVTVPVVSVVVQQCKYGENVEAIWILRATPLEDLGEFLRGVRKGLVMAFVVLPAAVVLVVLSLMFGWLGLLHGAFATGLALLGGLLFLGTLPMEVPFSRVFRPTYGGALLGIMFLASFIMLLFGGLHALVAAVGLPWLALGLLLVLAPIVMAWRRL